jgi:hypothetical protein
MTGHSVARDNAGTPSNGRPSPARLLALALCAASAAACAHTGMQANSGASPAADMSTTAPSPDPRVGLKAGLWDAGQAQWNLRLLSNSRPTGKFLGETNSDLAFTGQYAIEGSYNGFQVWDISNPSAPVLKTADYCPASQSDVSVYKNLLFVSGEGLSGRLDCGGQGVKDTVSAERLRGIRIFDISDLAHPKNVANVQTCRGSHTHTLLVDPNDRDNVYVYISGSAGVRSASELPGCVSATPDKDPNSALFRIEIIKVPLAHPEQAAIVSSAHLFTGLGTPQSHGEASADREAAAAQRAKGKFTAVIFGDESVLPDEFIKPQLEQIVKARGGTGAPTGADSATLRQSVQGIVNKAVAGQCPGCNDKGTYTPTQCHDITVYPSIGLAGGACEGYGMLLDIKDPAHPIRLDAVSDSNFSYWHSATFNNDGTKLLFSDEWGGGGQPKCRASDPHDWGADAIFAIQGQKLVFQSYYKMLAPQTSNENCVAHNGSLIPIPGRDVMVQAWYQGGISVFDWTDAAHPKEIAFFDRGPVDSTRLADGGEWSAYWYNGVIVGSEIARGLDIWELLPSGLISKNELDAAKSVHLPELNVQGQPKYVWPPSFALARAYADQLERSKGLSADQITAIRQALDAAEKASGTQRHDALTQLATQVDGDAGGAADGAKVQKLADAVRQLSSAPMASAETVKTAAGD